MAQLSIIIKMSVLCSSRKFVRVSLEPLEESVFLRCGETIQLYHIGTCMINLGISIKDSKTSCRRAQHCWPTSPNIVARMLCPFVYPVACCCVLLRVVVQSLKPIKLLSQQFLSFLLFCDRRSIEQQCCVPLHSSSITVGATHMHYMVSKVLWVVPFPLDALQIPALLGVVVSVCSPLSTWMQQIPTLFGQQCWQLLHSVCT